MSLLVLHLLFGVTGASRRGGLEPGSSADESNIDCTMNLHWLIPP